MIFRSDLARLDEFDYDLPTERIPFFPTTSREESKLLVATKDRIFDDYFINIEKYLPSESLLIVNSTKVIAARLLMQKPTGGAVELLCINPVVPSTDPQLTMAAFGSCRWECLVGGKNVRENIVLSLFGATPDIFSATIISRYSNLALVEFRFNPNESFSQALLKYGEIPLPPYIARKAEAIDSERYQTVYSNQEGSVAAPTAGLHFTQEIFAKLEKKNIQRRELILHVGPGTFKPVSTSIEEHDMHNEQFFVSQEILQALLLNFQQNKTLIATGTTSLRTLESLYWIGLKYHYEKSDIPEAGAFLGQFEPYELSAKNKLISWGEALETLLDRLQKADLSVFHGQTKLLISPGYQMQTAQMLITNFHMPKSTLLLLVSAFIGEKARKNIYNHALQSSYRFLSYGDSSLLSRVPIDF